MFPSCSSLADLFLNFTSHIGMRIWFHGFRQGWSLRIEFNVNSIFVINYFIRHLKFERTDVKEAIFKFRYRFCFHRTPFE